MINANIGEWSEFYAFLKILTERKLIPATADLQPDPSLAIPVLKVFRNETGTGDTVYDLSATDTILLIDDKAGSTVVFDTAKISSKLATIFSKISSNAASIPEAEDILRYLRCSHLRAMPAGSKEDIAMIIHDARTGHDPRMAYSIKSQVGSPSTLLNASKATNFLYELNSKAIDLSAINEFPSARKRIAELTRVGVSLNFVGMKNDIFRQNLELVDTAFPELMSVLLHKNYSSGVSSLKEIIGSFGEAIPLPNSGNTMKKEAAIYKVKHFLAAVALGMTPAQLWDGNLSATGGYLIIKSNGDLVCYHIFNMDSFKEYLFQSTKFEHASESRHGYGKLFADGGKTFINLNLQIRFVH